MSDSDQESVININFILKLRILFGFHHNISKNNWLEYLFKTLLLALGAYNIYMVSLCKGISDGIGNAARTAEYAIYLICSICTEEQYLVDYFYLDPVIDNKIYSNYVQRNIKTILLLYITALTCFYFVLYLFFLTDECAHNVHYTYVGLVCFANEIGRIPIVMIFILFYFRIKIFCAKLREEVIYNATAVCDWKEYVKIYIKILESLQRSDWPIKFMMVVHLIGGFVFVTEMQFAIIESFKKEKLGFGFEFVNVTLQLLYKYAVLFFPSFMVELIAEQMDRLKIEIAEKIIICTAERRRSNLRELLTYFREHPLSYCIARTIQVYSGLPLRYVSIAASYLVCLLQFSHVFRKE